MCNASINTPFTDVTQNNLTVAACVNFFSIDCLSFCIYRIR